MASFGTKRRGRVITIVDEDVPGAETLSGSDSADAKDETTKLMLGSKLIRRPFRQSSLRKSFNPTDEDGGGGGDNSAKDEDEDDGPVVVRPSVSRSNSTKQNRKKLPKSKLSFGVVASDEDIGGDDDGSTPQEAPLAKKAMGNSAGRRALTMRGLPTLSSYDDHDRPRYSKENLDELQSSTPNTPRDVLTLGIDDADEMELDASELEGALIVDTPAMSSLQSETRIFSEVEIRERKERRARLAKEQGFLSVEDDDDDDDDDDVGRKKKDETRIVAEEEDLGEGFDDYVEDGGLSLGKRARKERRKRERQQMAELIHAAEGHTSDSSSDSEAERRIAYETAQTRAGLDGLKKPRKSPADDHLQMPRKIAPPPSLAECLARFQNTLKSMEADLRSKEERVAQLRREREEIGKREIEVQALLDEMGKKYQEAVAQGKVGGGRATATGLGAELAGERGLESLGTPARRSDQEDVDIL